jgi:hypothetical protein
MPFKDVEARRAYMKQYLAEFREGRRRGDVERVPSARTVAARAKAERRRKQLWELQNAEWRVARRREQRRRARAEEAQGLLRLLPDGSGETSMPGGSARRGGNKSAGGRKRAA